VRRVFSSAVGRGRAGLFFEWEFRFEYFFSSSGSFMKQVVAAC